MTFLIGLIGSKIGRQALLALAFLIAIAAVYAYAKYRLSEAFAAGHAAAVTEMQAATNAEIQRRDAALATAQRDAQAAVTKLSEGDQKNADLLQRITKLSAAHDRDTCLDAAAAGRLRAIGADRRAAGNGTVKPAR